MPAYFNEGTGSEIMRAFAQARVDFRGQRCLNPNQGRNLLLCELCTTRQNYFLSKIYNYMDKNGSSLLVCKSDLYFLVIIIIIIIIIIRDFTTSAK